MELEQIQIIEVAPVAAHYEGNGLGSIFGRDTTRGMSRSRASCGGVAIVSATSVRTGILESEEKSQDRVEPSQGLVGSGRAK